LARLIRMSNRPNELWLGASGLRRQLRTRSLHESNGSTTQGRSNGKAKRGKLPNFSLPMDLGIFTRLTSPTGQLALESGFQIAPPELDVGKRDSAKTHQAQASRGVKEDLG
jgi:hypothetical protein